MAHPYKADHVGSLLRPKNLLDARAAYAEGRLPLMVLHDLEDHAILGAIELQRQVGLGIFTDGEFRRGSWLTDLAEAVEGFVADRVPLEWRGPGAAQEFSTANVAGAKLQQKRRLTAHEAEYLKQHAPGPIKMTLPAASNFLLASYKPGLSDQVYPTRAALLDDIAAILRKEVEALLDEGVAYVQLDAPYYSHYVDPAIRESIRQQGADPDEALDQSIAADNSCIRASSATASCWRCTSAAATTAAVGTPRAAMSRSPRSCSAASTWMPSCWSTTASSAPAASSRSASCPRARTWCWGS